MSECVSGEAEGERVGLLDAFVERVDWVDYRNRSKGLLAHDAGRLRHIDENRDRIKVSTSREASSACRHLGTMPLRILDQSLDGGKPAVIRDVTHLRRRIEAIAD